MARHSSKLREEARRLYLTNEINSISEIARRLKIKPHTVGLWKREEDWDGLRLKIDRQAAEKLVEKIASERVSLNSQHFRMWGLVVSQLFEGMQQKKAMDIRSLDKVASILDRAQKGQRLARGLSLDGQTEEEIRAAAEAESRALVDVFIASVKERVPDEAVRDQIARDLLDRLPVETDDEDDAREGR